jgi:hypothetical protein
MEIQEDKDPVEADGFLPDLILLTGAVLYGYLSRTLERHLLDECGKTS